MSTNIQIIGDALGLICVIGETSTPSAEQGSHGLRQLNRMMEQWEEDGLKFGYFEQTSTSATCPIPQWSEVGVVGALALRLAPFYGATITPEAADQADKGFSTILRKLVQPPKADMSHMPGALYPFDITTG